VLSSIDGCLLGVVDSSIVSSTAVETACLSCVFCTPEQNKNRQGMYPSDS
jgi:hypothetical protein